MAAVQVIPGSSGVATPQMVQFSESDTPPAATDAQRAQQQFYLSRPHGSGSIPDAAQGAVAGPDGRGATRVGKPPALFGLDRTDLPDVANPPPQVPGTFTVFRNVGLAPTTGSSEVNEPAHGNSGNNVFYVGNWYAARSGSQGTNWTYINPYADFPDFCCDQDVVYDPGRDLMLWYRQGVVLSGGNNNYKLGVSLDGGKNWAQYTITYTNYSGLPLGWFDYPQIAVSNNFLYITSNYFNPNFTFQRMMVTRISLDELRAQGGIGFTWWSRTTGYTWAPIQGAREVMYLGDHTSTTLFNICDQPESNTLLSCRDVAVPAWTSTPRGAAVCITPNGQNPCARLDQRVNVGYLKRNGAGTGQELGFFWSVAQGGGFAFPYVNAVAVDPATFAVLPGLPGRPFIWNGSIAFMYAGTAPNWRGHLGISTWGAGGGNYPTLYAGIDDDYNGPPPGWELGFISASNNVLSSNWGDYTRVRAHSPVANVWTLSGYVTNGSVQSPRYAVFGRERDTDGYNRFRSR
jgi:hypothetical protein